MIRISSMLAAGAFACAAMTRRCTFASANDAATTEFSAQERRTVEGRTTTRQDHDDPWRRHGEDAHHHASIRRNNDDALG